jgi:hypothetical protein
MERNKIVIDNSENKKSSKVKKFFYNVFVKDIAYKAISLGIALLLWLLMAGFNF